jgi:hypothetical protein
VTEPGSVLLDRAQIEEAFTALGDRLVRRGVVADVFIVGGAAMALAYDATRVTRMLIRCSCRTALCLRKPGTSRKTSGCRRGGSTSKPASTSQARTTRINAACSTIRASGDRGITTAHLRYEGPRREDRDIDDLRLLAGINSPSCKR